MAFDVSGLAREMDAMLVEIAFGDMWLGQDGQYENLFYI